MSTVIKRLPPLREREHADSESPPSHPRGRRSGFCRPGAAAAAGVSTVTVEGVVPRDYPPLARRVVLASTPGAKSVAAGGQGAEP